MSSNPTILPGYRGAVSNDEDGSIQQPVTQYSNQIVLDAEQPMGHSSQSNSNAYDVFSQSGGNQFRAPSDRQPELCGRYDAPHYRFYEDWNTKLVYDLHEKNSNNAWKYSFQKMSYTLRSWLYHFTEETLQQPPPQSPVELRPPPEAIRKFTSVLVSQHYPVETNWNVAKSINKYETVEAEWYMELRHFFVDLPTQLTELEEFLTGTSSAFSTNDNEENKADTRALANWTSYQLPDAFAGRHPVYAYPRARYPNLRYARRIVFSQRLDIQDNHDQSDDNSRWLTGRWLVVAYLFAPTRKAVKKMDVKSLLLSGCTPAGHGTYRNTNTMSRLNAYNPIGDVHMTSMRPGSGEWWLLPREDIFFQLQRCDDEMLATAFISQDPSDYDRPYVHHRNDHDSSTPDYRRHMERRLGDMERRLHDMERARPLPFAHAHGHGVGGGILSGLNGRCRLVDRMWPALMTGQDMKTAWDASGTTSSNSSTCCTPSSTSSTSSEEDDTTSDSDDDGDEDDDGEGSFGFIFRMVIGLVATAGALCELAISSRDELSSSSPRCLFER